jgi:hypothetical protein
MELILIGLAGGLAGGLAVALFGLTRPGRRVPCFRGPGRGPLSPPPGGPRKHADPCGTSGVGRGGAGAEGQPRPGPAVGPGARAGRHAFAARVSRAAVGRQPGRESMAPGAPAWWNVALAFLPVKESHR